MSFAAIVGEAADRARWASRHLAQYDHGWFSNKTSNAAICSEARAAIVPVVRPLWDAALNAVREGAPSAATNAASEAANLLGAATRSLQHGTPEAPRQLADVSQATLQLIDAIKHLDAARAGVAWTPAQAAMPSYSGLQWRQHALSPLSSAWQSGPATWQRPLSAAASEVHIPIQSPGAVPGAMSQIMQSIEMLGASVGAPTWQNPAGAPSGHVEVLVRRVDHARGAR